MSKNNHAFSFPGGELLSKMGASWFASYWHYDHRSKNEVSWKNCKTAASRISRYNKTKQYHNDWICEIKTMDDKRLNRNKLGLNAAQVKTLIK